MIGGGHDHPTPVELQNRLKWYILGKHSASAISRKENTEGDSSCTNLIGVEDKHCNNLNNPICSQFLVDENEIMIEKKEEEIFMDTSEIAKIFTHETEETVNNIKKIDDSEGMNLISFSLKLLYIIIIFL